MCPHCGREAPLLYRGPLAYCSACNKPRVPLSAGGVNLTGKPAKIGGTVASVLGWTVLAVMLGIALILGALLQAIFPPGALVGWAVGGVVAALGVAAALVLLLGGRFLHSAGERASLKARKDAVFALAQNQKGIVRSDLVGSSLGIGVAEADAFLTELSRQPDGGVVLEVDNDGKLFYRFPAILAELPWPGPLPDNAVVAEQARLRVPKTELTPPVSSDVLPEEAEEVPDDEPVRVTKRART